MTDQRPAGAARRISRGDPVRPPNAVIRRRRWLGVLALLVIVLVSYIDRVNVSVLITDRAFTDHFRMSGNPALQGMLMTIFLVGYGIAAFLLTPMYETALGVWRGLLVSVASWALLTLVSPYAYGALMLLAVRALLGGSEGPLFSLKTMYVQDNFASHEVGKPNAVSSMGVSLGTAVGLPLVTYLIYHFDWSSSFLLLALLNAVVGLPLAWLFIRGPAGAASPERSQRRFRSTLRLALRTPRLASILLVEIATLAYLWGSSSWLPSYLLHARHFSITTMGVVSSLPFLMSLVSGLLGGWLIDRLPTRRLPLLLIVGSIGTGACVMLAIGAVNPWLAAAALILANGFWGLQGPVIPTLVQHSAEPGAVGSAYGVINGVGNIISAFMPTAMGIVIGVAGGHDFGAGYVLLVGTQAITLICGARLLSRGRRNAANPEADSNRTAEPRSTDAV